MRTGFQITYYNARYASSCQVSTNRPRAPNPCMQPPPLRVRLQLAERLIAVAQAPKLSGAPLGEHLSPARSSYVEVPSPTLRSRAVSQELAVVR
jgi:hypothetical protein